jgi:alpha-ribazole phosphatase CobZ
MTMKLERGPGYVALLGRFQVLSSAPFRGGMQEAEAVVCLQVEEDYRGDSQATLDDFCREKGWKAVGFLTAADVSRAAVVSEGKVTCMVTAGLSNASRASTINILLAIDAALSPSAMANATIVATEAKVSTLADLDLRSGVRVATGTSTDAVAVACYGRTPVDYSGPATSIGRSIRVAVRRALRRALAAAEDLTPDRELSRRLEERGITMQHMEEVAFALFEAPHGRTASSDDREAFRRTVEHFASDTNVRALWEAAFGAAEAQAAGRLDVEGDPASLVADEILGQALAEYIGGKRALFNFFRYDHAKPGILRALDPFLDDALAGFIAGCMTRALEEEP